MNFEEPQRGRQRRYVAAGQGSQAQEGRLRPARDADGDTGQAGRRGEKHRQGAKTPSSSAQGRLAISAISKFESYRKLRVASTPLPASGCQIHTSRKAALFRSFGHVMRVVDGGWQPHPRNPVVVLMVRNGHRPWAMAVVSNHEGPTAAARRGDDS